MTKLRYIDHDNAASLGYDPEEYAAGRWVIEQGDTDEWIADLPDSLGLEQPYEAQRAADERIKLGAGKWETLPSNYGAAYYRPDDSGDEG